MSSLRYDLNLTLQRIFTPPAVLMARLWSLLPNHKEPWENKLLLGKVKAHTMVSDVTVDPHNRIVVTTKPLYVTLKGKDKVIGKYQIRIDFGRVTRNGRTRREIQILNISQRCHGMDSPVIQDTRPCWGTATMEKDRLLALGDLQGLVDMLLYYITSPTVSHGYMSSWYDWFRGAAATRRWYDFEKYDDGERETSQRTAQNLDLGVSQPPPEGPDISDILRGINLEQLTPEQRDAVMRQAQAMQQQRAQFSSHSSYSSNPTGIGGEEEDPYGGY